MVVLNNVSIPFRIKLTNVRKVPLKYVLHSIKFMYRFNIEINDRIILKGLSQTANSIDQVRDIVMEDFIHGIKKIY